jgi:hypothetical protein
MTPRELAPHVVAILRRHPRSPISASEVNRLAPRVTDALEEALEIIDDAALRWRLARSPDYREPLTAEVFAEAARLRGAS